MFQDFYTDNISKFHETWDGMKTLSVLFVFNFKSDARNVFLQRKLKVKHSV